MEGNTLKDFRTKILGQTQGSMAEHLGVHQGTVSRLEQSGEKPDRMMRLALAALAMGITDYDLGDNIVFTVERQRDKRVRS